jgi:serine/threonine protein kinase
MVTAMVPTSQSEEGSRQPPPSMEAVAAAFPQIEILELIGQGGMGVVYKARQPKLHRLVALKLLPASLAERDPAFAGRFEREGQLLARLHHPDIVAVHDSGTAGEFFYLIMEFVDGVNLRQAMRARRFTPAQALAIVPHICDALQYAHDEGVLHRDIKPENILLDAKGRVKLADFGIAKLLADLDPSAAHTAAADTGLTLCGTALGTPSYMAPEQRETPADIDHRADIYSLGVVFYELLTGELPRERFTPPSAKSDADPRVDAIVQQALEKERDRRQGSAGEVKTQVEKVTSRDASTSAPAKTSIGAERDCRRRADGPRTRRDRLIHPAEARDHSPRFAQR